MFFVLICKKLTFELLNNFENLAMLISGPSLYVLSHCLVYYIRKALFLSKQLSISIPIWDIMVLYMQKRTNAHDVEIKWNDFIAEEKRVLRPRLLLKDFSLLPRQAISFLQ